MNFDNPNPEKKYFWGVGGDVAAGYEHVSRHIFYTQHIVRTSSTELYSLVKIFLMVFEIEGIVALTIKKR